MAPPISKTSAEPTLYDILSLTPKHLEGQASAAQQQKIVKQAYRRALLNYHPDKAASKDSEASASASASSSTPKPSDPKPSPQKKSQSKSQPQKQPRIRYTVDQIQHAYGVLSDHKQRAEYNRILRSQNRGQQAAAAAAASSFQTGVETVDLDDVAFDERTGVYYRACRCGNARGYAFTEENLEEFEDDGVLMVECLDCSLWVRVLFAAAEEDEVDNGNDGSNGGGTREGEGVVAAKSEDADAVAVTTAGERRGSGTTGRGFTFNWSVNWGISLSGSVAAGRSSVSRR
ncbi:hypothetical protein F4820DRAFT_114321 [Hypoxylon rubiginosum]|uniref:Uncharacterized protein n=1 Tax=Hypoxylon rubiginosum TaxID=110542 RepID=A0ACB9ZCR5_9PEZI|nr:hypothetical protein F4820DRAFT_114321 [Hypoxylon rubiginosum]